MHRMCAQSGPRHRQFGVSGPMNRNRTNQRVNVNRRCGNPGNESNEPNAARAASAGVFWGATARRVQPLVNQQAMLTEPRRHMNCGERNKRQRVYMHAANRPECVAGGEQTAIAVNVKNCMAGIQPRWESISESQRCNQTRPATVESELETSGCVLHPRTSQQRWW